MIGVIVNTEGWDKPFPCYKLKALKKKKTAHSLELNMMFFGLEWQLDNAFLRPRTYYVILRNMTD